ncbi:DciA family protein [Streptomyces sp. NRRL F-2890]|uniref:DciA family protein n=1 Tax=Streptomyces sp. NRRL F-2890 TaxID=1463845 RepID=UPI000AC2A36B|nr:DUF721 domain-containing protein [Streptomyces sp. NRRL F-2890]
MTSTPTSRPATVADGPSGADLARATLAAARAASKTRPRGPVNQPRKPRSSMRGPNRRDPARIGSVLPHLVTAQAWERPTAGGSVMDRWAQIAPELAEGDLVVPVAYDTERQVLTLRPASSAYGTQLRLFGPQLIARINRAMHADVVRQLKVLPPGSGRGRTGPPSTPAPLPDRTDPAADTVRRPARATGEESQSIAPPEFRRMREEMRAARAARDAPADPVALRERYFAGAYDREPEPEIDEDALAAAARARRDAPSRQAAVLRARQDKANRTPPARRAFGTGA